ncbi:sulfotransferase domain-containing protein [Aquipuribacter sp. SD81]|uniref:sulfotransferase domain-containing protein n=1 Tax=Aquipuribacter sp. SD81 TaxID=3127703 RepID=UPI003018C6D4
MAPDFVVAGAQRCGTTSLFRALAAHPDVVAPLPGKGVHHFDTASAYVRGPEWYLGHFPLAAPARTRTGGRARTGEASPYYLFHPLAAERIATTVPLARVVVLLRDPVERAFSAWKQERGRGFETEDFERALDLEPERLAGEEERIRNEPGYQSFSHQHHAYVARGRYADQLERMSSALAPGTLFVAETQDVLADDGETWDALLRHLDLRAWRPPEVPRANARPSTPMPDRLRARLESQFHDSDSRLAPFLGKAPSWRS